MRVRTRDGIVVAVLITGAILVRLAWHPLGPWVSLGIAFAAGLAAIAAYRVRPEGPATGGSRTHPGTGGSPGSPARGATAPEARRQ